MLEKNEAVVRTPPTTAAPVTIATQNAAVKADPKEVRREVIQKLREYKRRLDARQELQERYVALCSRLYSERSSRITGMPVNHDQVAAQDRFIAMIDEKMELEREMAAEVDKEDEMKIALSFLYSRERTIITALYLTKQTKKALEGLQSMLGLASSQIYRLRNQALDHLAEMILPCNHQQEGQL